MIYIFLTIVGLAMGSFVNALIWRIYQQGDKKKTKATIHGRSVNLSIAHGRSVCIHCGHELAVKDLIPVVSWLSLAGKCRYCGKPIEDTPVAEILTMALFVMSYVFWPYALTNWPEWSVFGLWLAIVVGLVALTIYDFKHMLLPNRIVFPLMFLGAVMRLAFLIGLEDGNQLGDIAFQLLAGLAVGGGVFYLIFQISNGTWIGGGDVKLGFLMGIVLGYPNIIIGLLSAFYIAAFIIMPLMLVGKVSRKSKIPFGPFLIAGFILTMLWGEGIRDFYLTLLGIR